jgi:hypothetical protein
MKPIKSLFRMIVELVAVGIIAIVLILAFRRVSGGTSGNNVPADSNGVQPTLTYDPSDKWRYTPPPAEVNAKATGAAERATGMALWETYTPIPPPTPIYYPVKTIDDIPQVVLNSPYFREDVNDPVFGPCVKAANPGKALFVKSLDKALADYYVVPFYKDSDVCGIAFVGVENGKGTLGAWSGAGGTPYPPISSADAEILVEKAGYKVSGEPQLVFQWLQEGTSEFWPFWAITTVDNQTIYVVYTRGVIALWNAKDVHPIN